MTRRGRRKLCEADVYALTIPAPLAAHLELWPDDANGREQWIERHRIGSVLGGTDEP